MAYKIKYQGGITKKVCRWLADYNRKILSRKLTQVDFSKLIHPKNNTFDVISFSGSRDFEEQLLSIYSFLLYAGTPVKWTLYSDGTYTEVQIHFLQDRFPFLEVCTWNQFDSKLSLENKNLIEDYTEISPASKKVTVLSCHPYERQTIYADSDILFYEAAKLFQGETELHKGFWFMTDIGWNTLERSALRGRETLPLNLGFVILNAGFNFEEVFSYLRKLSGNFSYFSDQTAFHNAFHQQKAKALDQAKFILDVSDQFDFSSLAKTKQSVLRHYVTPVRHKMWQKNWYKI